MVLSFEIVKNAEYVKSTDITIVIAFIGNVFSALVTSVKRKTTTQIR